MVNGKMNLPDSKIHEANVGPTWGHQDPGGPHVGHMNYAILLSNVLIPILRIFRKVTQTISIWLWTFLPIHNMILPTPDSGTSG